MSISLLHGDHIASSRQRLSQIVEEYRVKKYGICTLEANSVLTPGILESQLGSQNMFAPDTVVVIEGLLTMPRSTKKTALLSVLQTFRSDTIILLWEPKKATAAVIKSVVPDKQDLFSLSSALFSWLDNLQSPIPKRLSALREAINIESADLCFLMLARQMRLYIKIHAKAVMKDHPFVIKKATTQAKKYTFEQLLKLHENLLLIDVRQKTGTSKLTLEQELEEMMLKL